VKRISNEDFTAIFREFLLKAKHDFVIESRLKPHSGRRLLSNAELQVRRYIPRLSRWLRSKKVPGDSPPHSGRPRGSRIVIDTHDPPSAS
jgi:hypothetical protein